MSSAYNNTETFQGLIEGETNYGPVNLIARTTGAFKAGEKQKWLPLPSSADHGFPFKYQLWLAAKI